MYNWDLSDLYLGLDDQNYQNDFNQVIKMIEDLDNFANTLDSVSKESVKEVLERQNALTFKVRKYGRIEFFKTFDDIVRDEYGNIIGFHMIPQINVETADR